ncbi:MAG TPA: 4'-phosphopantetheinyl transferase superfamily protein [Verrucomicrobiae bacterium]|nr:4'-phosphopantetheinyl transferase superfamily protein [Verrucomicrobiae bacterium]
MTDPWLSRARPPNLGNAEAHLWVAVVDTVAGNLPRFPSTLSTDERERAAQFLKDADRRRYMAARALLRHLLGAYAGADPGQLRFTYDAAGKPGLAADAPHGSVNFSVSHSGDLALFGFARQHRIGVDIERIRPDIDVRHLAERFFSKNEFGKLNGLPADQQRDAFFRCWTRKEAYLKARGGGIAHGLDRFEVTLGPAEPAAILSADDDPDAPRHWTLAHLTPAPGYLGATAVEAVTVTFQCFRWGTG